MIKINMECIICHLYHFLTVATTDPELLSARLKVLQVTLDQYKFLRLTFHYPIQQSYRQKIWKI